MHRATGSTSPTAAARATIELIGRRSPPQLDEAERDRLRVGPLPHVNPHPYNASARWPATSAGTGVPTWSRPGIWRPVGLQTWQHGPARRGPAAGRPWPDGSAGASSPSMYGWTGIRPLDCRAHRRGRRRAARWTAAAEAETSTVAVEVIVARRRPVVAARIRRRSRCTTGDGAPCPTPDGGRLDDWQRPDRLPHRRARHHRRTTHGTPFAAGRQRTAGLRPRASTGSPTTASRAGSTRERLRAPAGARPRRRRQPAAGLGRRHLRDRRLLRLRRAGAAGLAGLPVRLRRLPRGGAAARGGRGRGARDGRPAEPHPSLVLWNGNNENIWGFAGLGLASGRGRARPGARVTTSTCCRRIVAELDPTRPYWPGSPYSPRSGRAPERPAHGTDAHLGRVEPPATTRPTATTGPGSSPSSASRRRRPVDPDPRRPRRAAAARRRPACCTTRRPTTATASSPAGSTATFRRRANFDDWHWADPAQPGPGGHARHRALPVAGTAVHRHVLWQLNDCWPVISWAAVDGDGRRKPCGTRCAPATPTGCSPIQPSGGGLDVAAVNDSDQPWAGTVAADPTGWDGQVLARPGDDRTARPHGRCGGPPCRHHGADRGRPDVGTDCRRDCPEQQGLSGSSPKTWPGQWTSSRSQAIRRRLSRATVSRWPDGYRVDVTARGRVRAISRCSSIASIPTPWSTTLLITLLPGESASFSVRCPVLDDPLVLDRATGAASCRATVPAR